jgi:hypothetical protein
VRVCSRGQIYFRLFKTVVCGIHHEKTSTVHRGKWIWIHPVPAVRPGLRSVNDPSAGSPTETLLRLLLPLNGKVRISSRPNLLSPRMLGQSESLTGSFNR